MIRIRGYALASFKETGTPDSAINFILDELQNGRNAYMVGGAARGLRGAKHPKAQYVSFLIQGVYNLKYHDDSFDLKVFKPKWPLKNPSSGRLEIFRTLKWLKGHAKAALPELKSFLNNTQDFSPDLHKEIQKTIDIIEEDKRELELSCCEVEGRSTTKISWLWKGMRNIRNIGNLEVQNENGQTLPLEDIINRKPTVVAFFYTRCMNPNKCTLTINKIGWLQKKLIQNGLDDKVNLLAFTYDPGYDTPTKMRVFGENRGIVFGSNVHVLRTRPEQFDILSDFFQLGVNHVSSTVNQHRLELFLLNHNGNIKITYKRLQWTVDSIFKDIEKLLKKSSRFKWINNLKNSILQTLFPVLLIFFPKCPVCWGVYLSAFGISSLQSIPYSPWLIPFIFIVILINLFIMYRKSKIRNGLIPFWISLTGGVLILIPGYLLSNEVISILGVFLILIGSLLNSLSFKHWSKISSLFSSSFHDLKKAMSKN
ncbi:SCO family protein [uncultured Psychroserpens sp.]|uniref:SCO family protein n=1 Tax=uncultured Psychroserpens sp. TaxID=255436 RepID=UPI00262206E4|nr:SCO family protein [uncultured Psychroserpens sp.]